MMGKFRVCWSVPDDGTIPALPPGSPVTSRGFYADVTANDANQANWAVAQLTSPESSFTGTVQLDAQAPVA